MTTDVITQARTAKHTVQVTAMTMSSCMRRRRTDSDMGTYMRGNTRGDEGMAC